MWVHDLRDADASCGGKATGLARLIAAGLEVPPGFVISGEAFTSIVGPLEIDGASDVGHVLARAADAIASTVLPADLERAVRDRAAALGSLVAVRSSATIEDSTAGSAAGVFSSRVAVPVADVWRAIRAVWASALTPLSAAYARRRGGAIAIGVIVQEWIHGAPVVVYTRPPGRPTSHELLVQRDGQVSRCARDDLPREIADQHAALLALRCERALAVATGVDVELVQVRRQSGVDVALETLIVQARPIVHPAPRALAPPPAAALAPLQDGRTWRWDVAHNPDPLSLAQQGLVERVEAAGIAPWSLRVCTGYLYSASRAEPAPEPLTAQALQQRGEALVARLDALLTCEAPLAPGEAIDRYLAFYAVWARELSPLIGAARAVLPAALRRRGHPRPEAAAAAMIGRRASPVEAVLLAAARGELELSEVERRLGPLAPAWDVSVPTFSERPGLLADAVARAARALATAQPAVEAAACEPENELADELHLARAAAELAEQDDMLFARAQSLVRHALLARAARLGVQGDDVFWLPLDEVVTAAALDPVGASRRASAARAAAERAARWQMPLVVGGTSDGSAGTSLRGEGTGPRVAGRVVRFASLATAIAVGAGDVVVARSITPALAVLVAGCAALVSETGGLLDHGAALARELGIPCVVGCQDAWATLADGTIVTVDGDGGVVTAGYSSSSS